MKKSEKIQLILDSSSGLTKKEAEKKGILLAPILIEINGEEKLSGINIDNKALYKALEAKAKVKTASTPLGIMINLIEEGLNKSEKVFIITLSKEMSFCNQNAILASKEFPKEKVYIYDSKFITPWLAPLIPKLLMLAKEGKQKEMIKLLDISSTIGKGYLAPSNLEQLYRGGRITRIQYLAGSIFNVFPIITVQEGSLTKKPVIKTRNKARTAKKIASLVYNDYTEALKIYKEPLEIATISINDNEFEKMIRKELKKLGIKKIESTELSPEIVAHIGYKASGAGIGMKHTTL